MRLKGLSMLYNKGSLMTDHKDFSRRELWKVYFSKPNTPSSFRKKNDI